MRSYPLNSPEAAARVLAVALLADGHCSLTEVQALEQMQAASQLGMTSEALRGVVQDLCHDLLANHRGQWTGSFQPLDASVWSALLGEVTDRPLQQSVLALCTRMVQADGHVTSAEVCMLDKLRQAWP